MRKFILAISAVISLIFTVLMPVAPAMSVDTVNKVFTVTKSDGSPYQGVSVALLGWDEALQQNMQSSVSTTDSQGHATVAVAKTTDFYGYAAQPPVNDFSHAVFVEYGVTLGQAENLAIQMRPANLVVELKQTNGQNALPGSWVHFPATGDVGESLSARPIIRSGPIPIDVSTGLTSTENYIVKAEPNAVPGEFWSEFGLKVSDSNAISLYTDSTATTALTPRVVGGNQIYDLVFSSANLHGKIANAAGQAQTLPSGTTARVSFYKADSSGSIDPNGSASADAIILASGLYDARITKPAAGKYFPVFTVAGSLSYPSFTGAPLYIDANGQYSNSASGPFVAPESFVLNSTLPTGAEVNLKVRVVEPGGTAADSAFIVAIRQFESGDSLYMGAGQATNGLGSLSLEDGIYNLLIEFSNPDRTRREYSLVVDQGEATLSLRGGSIIVPGQDGVYQLSGGVPNLKLKIVNPSDSTSTVNNVSIAVFDTALQGDNFVTGGWAQAGTAYLTVPIGTFELRLDPQGTYAQRTYTLVVSSSGIAITDPTTQATITAVNGVFSLAPNLPNITGRIVNSLGQPVGSKNSAWVNVNLQKWLAAENRWEWVNGGNAPVLSDGTFGMRANETGTYRLSIQSNGRIDVANTFSSQFVITDLNSLSARGDIAMAQPILKVRVTQNGRTSYLNSAQINVSDRNGYDDWADTGTLGAAPISFPGAGTYYLTVNPPYGLSTAVAANRTYVAVVTDNSGTLSASITGLTASAGFYDLALGVPNVTGKIVAPNGSALTRSNGVWISINAQKYIAQDQRWDWTDYWTQIASDGSFGLSLQENGIYRLRIEPNGVEGASLTRSVQFEVTDANRDSVAKAFGNVTLSTPSAKIKVRLPGSTADVKYAGIEVRKGDQWYDWLNTNQNGVANFSAAETGTYEFIANPNGDSSVNAVRKSYTATVTESPAGSGTFVVAVAGAQVDSNGFTILNLGVPNITGKLLDQNGVAVTQQNRVWVDIQLQKYDSAGGFWDWQNNSTNVRNDGTFGMSVTTPGTYRLLINPYGRQDIARTESSQFTITSSNASTFTKSFGSITMNGPTLSGTVSTPVGLDPVTKLANSQVLAVNAETGQEMWEYSTQTDYLGRWSMMLPKGTYSVFARSPWGNQNFGSGDALTGISVNASGVATITSGNVNNLDLRVSLPTWSGTTVAPGTSDPLPFTSVCLFQETAGKPTNQCTESDVNGKWALSKPLGFTGFNETTQLSIRENRSPQYAEARYVGKTDVEAQLGVYVAGQTFGNKQISPLAPNTTLTVLAGNAPAANMWVSIERDNYGWLTSGMTNAQGVVRLNIPSIGSGFKIRAQVESNRELAAIYTTTTKSISGADVAAGTTSGVFSNTVNLALPNFLAQVVTPGSSPVGVQNSWVDAFNENTNSWMGGNNSLSNGNISLKLDVPTAGITYRYRINVNAPWGNPDLLASRRYFVSVIDDGSMVVHADTETGTAVTPTAGRYALSLKSPSVTGTAVLPDSTPVRDSYVNVLKMMQNWEQWMEGGQTRANGMFGLALEDGNYEVFANVPWNTTGYAKSSRCAITVTGGALASNGSGCVVDGQVRLALREPNLKFKLVHAGAAVANANVNIQIGNWHTWAQSGRDGNVALFIDSDEVKAKNSSLTTGTRIDVRVTVDPPYGNNDIVRWDCIAGQAKPLCQDLGAFVVGTEYLPSTPVTELDAVEFAIPNTRLNVKLPGGTNNAGSGAWVSLLVEKTGWKQWIGGSNTSADGEAVFNIDDILKDDPTVRFTIEVNAPYQQRETYSQKSYSGLTWAQIDGDSFELGTPNLKLTIMQSLGVDASAWAWVGIEEVDASTFAWIGWLGGYGVDQFGKVSLNLPSSKTVRLTLNPGPGSNGARTACIFTVNAQGLVAKSTATGACTGNTATVDGNKAISLELGAGNVIGTVTKGSTNVGLAGAIVFAQAFEAGTSTEKVGVTEQSVTKADGRFGLQLDAAYDWKIKVFFVNPDGATEQYESSLTGRGVASSTLGNQQTQNFELAVRS